MDLEPTGWYEQADTTEQVAGTARDSMATRHRSAMDLVRTSGSVGLMLAGVVLLELAVFLPWTESGRALAASPSTLVYNLPSMILVLVAGPLALFRSSRGHAAVLTVLVGLWVLVGLTTELSHAWHVGQGLSAASCLFLLAGGCSCLMSQASLRLDPGTVLWAVGAAAIAVLWTVGEWLPWVRATYAMTKVGQSQRTYLHTDCCVPFQNQTELANIREALTMLLLLAASIGVSMLWRRTLSGVGLLALGVLYVSDPLAWLYGLATPSMSRQQLINVGATSEQIDTLHLTGTVSGLPGGWIALGAALLLVLYGNFRILSAVASRAYPTPHSGFSGFRHELHTHES